jgi:hypothetical protein
VSRLAIGIWRRFLQGLTCRLESINGEPGVVDFAGDRPVWVFTIDTDGVHILAGYSQVNPDKLKGI